jgi:hypothetical protein
MKKLQGWKFFHSKGDEISLRVWRNQREKREFEETKFKRKKTPSLFLGFARLEQLEGSRRRRRRRRAGESWHFVFVLLLHGRA